MEEPPHQLWNNINYGLNVAPEKDATTSGLARMNMILHNNPEALIVQGNTLTDLACNYFCYAPAVTARLPP